jgi:hypothetical protein
MGLLNYTTTIDVGKTIGEIQSILARGKAEAILTEFDGAGNVTAISFRAPTKFGVVSFRLPCDVRAITQTLNNQVQARKIPRRYLNDTGQARRVGWRIIKDWLEAQLAIVELQMVTIDQVFLPYAQAPDGRTVYELLLDRKFDLLALKPPKTP